MSPRLFIGWTIATLITLVAAIAVVLVQPSQTTVTFANEPAFPALRADPDAVARVIISTADGSFSLIRNDEGIWVSPDKFNYRVSSEKLRALIVGLNDMRLVEAKTARAERYPRLEVEDISANDAKSRLLRLEDVDGDAIVSVIVGKRRSRFTAGHDAGTYLRRPDEDQAWLASGGLTVHDQLNEWLEPDIIDVAADSVRRVEIAPADSGGYVAERESKDDPFRLTPLPEGREPDNGALTRLASGLSRVELEDVKPAAEFDGAGTRRRVRLTTFDNIEVTAELTKTDEATWATFAARYAADGDDGSDAAAAVRARVDEINARVNGWAYRLADYVASRLEQPLDKLLEPEDKTS